MPEIFTGAGIKREETVGKQIRARAIRTVEIIRSGTKGKIGDTTFLVNRHSTPVIGSPNIFPGVFGPRIVTVLARMRNGVEDPCHFSGAYIVRTNIPGGDPYSSPVDEPKMSRFSKTRPGVPD